MSPEKERESGRELDAIVAERVMGWTWREKKGSVYAFLLPPDDWSSWLPASAATQRGNTDTWPLPRYSTDIASAFLVVQKMQADDDYRFDMGWGGEEHPRWFVSLKYDYNHLGAVGHANHDREWHAEADTLPLAICLVALDARRSEKAAVEGTP